MAECFTRVSRETSYLYGKRSPTPRRHLNCTRGAIPGALDRHLLDLVRTHGVEVQWSSAFTATVNRPGPGAIIATGHSSRPYQLLGIPCEALEAYWAAMPYDGEPILVSYRSDYTDPDYAYVASRDGWISALLFARGRPIEGGALERFQKELYETEGIRFDRWKRGRGAAPLAPRFEVGGFRVAGALGGMIDPFYLSGVAAALISGGLAALSFVDPIHARFEYQRLTRHFRLKRLLRAGMQCRGAPRALRFALMVLDRIPQPVGALR
jgi:flavin-dependent dehydrogenase